MALRSPGLGSGRDCKLGNLTMKKALLAGSALLAMTAATSPALAADGIKLNLGGYFRSALLVNFDNHGTGSLGDKRYADAITQDARIYFSGKTTLDNGITVGAKVELLAETKTGNQIYQAYGYMQGGLGELRFGGQKGSLEVMCVTPVGGTANFSAFTTNQVINNANVDLPGSGKAPICRDVDDMIGKKSQKLVYISPNFGGFQLGVSWAPNGNHLTADDGVGDFHSGMPKVQDGEQRNVIDAYAVYKHDFDGWGVTWGGGGSWAASLGGSPTSNQKKASIYQTGLNFTFGKFAIGGAFSYLDNVIQKSTYHDSYWVAGGGIAYTLDAWTLGLQYSHNQGDYDKEGAQRRTNTMAVTANYAMGPGINIDGTVQYTWANGDSGDAAHGGYNALSLGLGTAFKF